MNRLSKISGIQPNSHLINKNDSPNVTCPMCFIEFSPSHIQLHASNCKGEPKKSLVSEEITSTEKQFESVESVEKSSKKAMISSFFKSESQGKRSVPDNNSSITYNSPKKYKSVEQHNINKVESNNEKNSVRRPLADVMRPTALEHYKGQEDIVGVSKNGFWMPIFQSISKQCKDVAFPSMIFWGPPGCGKTSLANILSSEISKTQGGKWRFTRLSACNAGVAQVKEEITKAKSERNFYKRSTILFIDEIHRFNKIQQDALLPHVEDGTITLLGATTENPSFSVNSALLSRCRVLVLKKLSSKVILEILKRALNQLNVTIVDAKDETQAKEKSDIMIDDEAVEYLSNISDGDARTALNCLEVSLQMAKDMALSTKISANGTGTVSGSDSQKRISISDIKANLSRSHMLYDKKGDEHYNCASALQKSIRGSDDSAALYWLMRMFQGGEDPLFIARRLVRIASEDVGLGDPSAIGVAVSAMQGCQLIGRPECDVILSQCAVYLARANKSHEVYKAMNSAKQLIADDMEGKGLPPVPLHLRNATSSLGRNLGYGEGYSSNLNHVHKTVYMPDELKETKFFEH